MMQKTNIFLAFLLLIGALIVIGGVVLLVQTKKNEMNEKIEIENEKRLLVQQSLMSVRIAEKKESKTMSPILDALHSTSSPVTGFPFHMCTKDDKYRQLKEQWSVTVEACTENVGTPLNGLIQNWQMGQVSPGHNDLRCKLHENGNFDINELGFYRIETRVTFKNRRQNAYSINISGASGSTNNITVKSPHLIPSYDIHEEIESVICGNVTQKESIFIKIRNNALILFFPKATYFKITKFK